MPARVDKFIREVYAKGGAAAVMKKIAKLPMAQRAYYNGVTAERIRQRAYRIGQTRTVYKAPNYTSVEDDAISRHRGDYQAIREELADYWKANGIKPRPKESVQSRARKIGANKAIQASGDVCSALSFGRPPGIDELLQRPEL
ncbi:MAG: hypothetical protein AAFN78_00920 [Pseudomonadota bacterium]